MTKRLFVASLILGLAVAGCGRDAQEKLTEKLIEKGMGGDGSVADVDVSGDKIAYTATDAEGKRSHVRIEGEQVTIAGEDGTVAYQAGGDGKLPQGFPEDAFVYPGAKIATSMSFPQGVNVAFETKDAVATVVAKYAAEMKAKGWNEKSTMKVDEVNMASYEKGKRTASVIVQEQNGVTQINLTINATEE
mgnify:CR=1 FL=1